VKLYRRAWAYSRPEMSRSALRLMLGRRPRTGVVDVYIGFARTKEIPLVSAKDTLYPGTFLKRLGMS